MASLSSHETKVDMGQICHNRLQQAPVVHVGLTVKLPSELVPVQAYLWHLSVKCHAAI
jgi:hypothetical protein